MRGHLLFCPFCTFFQREFVLPVFKYFLYCRIIIKPRAGCPSASIYKPFLTNSRSEAKDTSARFVSLFRMWLGFYYVADIVLYVTMYGCCLLQELLRVPICQNPLVGSQVFFLVSIAIGLVVSCIGGNLLVLYVYIHYSAGIEDINFLANVFIRYAVIMPLQTYISILLHSSRVSLLKLKTNGIQWSHAIPFQFFELLTPAVGTSAEQCVIVQFQSHPDSNV